MSTTRRTFLTAAVPAMATNIDHIEAAADTLAAAMAALHGGTWVAIVDHDAGFILIQPGTVRGRGALPK